MASSAGESPDYRRCCPYEVLTICATDHKNPERVAAGLKAAMHNPNVSEEAKERAAERLDGMNTSDTDNYQGGNQETNRALGGYKATLSVSTY